MFTPNDGIPLPLHIAGGFSLDAVIHSDGRAETNRIGGNAFWAIVGALAANIPPYAHGILGRDFPVEVLDKLRAFGVDCAGVRQDNRRLGVRITHSYANDGARSQPAAAEAVARLSKILQEDFIDTTAIPEEILESLPKPGDLPSDISGSAWHLGLLPVTRFMELVEHIHTSGAAYLQVDAPARTEIRDRGIDVLENSLEYIDVFLPSTSDTDIFLPHLSAEEIIRVFRDHGAQIVVLKMGENGALLAETNGDYWHIPAFPEKLVVDLTGAGDVFAGVFAAKFIRSGNLLSSICSAAAVASISIRHKNPLDIPSLDSKEITQRTHFIEKNVRKL